MGIQAPPLGLALVNSKGLMGLILLVRQDLFGNRQRFEAGPFIMRAHSSAGVKKSSAGVSRC